MTDAFLHGFTDELTKVGSALGALKRVGKFSVKHPLIALTAAGTAAATGMAASGAYKQGLRGGEKPRYLAAAVDPNSGRAAASPAAYTNFHELFNQKPRKGQLKRLHKDYDESKFKR